MPDVYKRQAINRAGIHFQHAASLCSSFQCLVGSGGVARVGFIKKLAAAVHLFDQDVYKRQVLNSAILSITLVLPVSSLMYRRRLPVGEQFRLSLIHIYTKISAMSSSTPWPA